GRRHHTGRGDRSRPGPCRGLPRGESVTVRPPGRRRRCLRLPDHSVTMIDWHHEDEGNPLPDFPAEAPHRSRKPRPFLAVLVLLLALAGFGAARWHLARTERAMRADLEEFVIGEERLRLGGLKEDVHALVAPETPQVWLDSYLDTFRPPEESRPVDVEVTEIE